MTLAQEKMLGVKLDLCHSLLVWEERFGGPAHFSLVGNYGGSTHFTAMRWLVKNGMVEKSKLKCGSGRGYRWGYAVTVDGKEWLQQARAIYAELIKQPSSK